MAEDRMQRRHVREKTVIDHLADKLFDPDARVDEPPLQSANTQGGLPVEGQVRKKWSPKKGGLPTFLQK